MPSHLTTTDDSDLAPELDAHFDSHLGVEAGTQLATQLANGARLDDAVAHRFESHQIDSQQDSNTSLSLAAIMQVARQRKQLAHGRLVSYSPKVFLPITHLCRDVCRYCTFAQTPSIDRPAYLSVDDAVEVARRGAALGCREALFTLGDRPEARYRAAREALDELGFDDTLSYVAHVARCVFEETGLLPHLNPGVMTHDELVQLRPFAASMGIMLESVSARLCEKGGPHFGSPDKDPQVRLDCIDAAGELSIPFTSGILIGIGETRAERIDSLLALRAAHERHGHLQEVIIQNFRAKPATLMADNDEPELNDFLWTIGVARLIMPPEMNIQAPPNLSPGDLDKLLEAGINDWGGVSPVTADFVNPEAPWPAVDRLRAVTEASGQSLLPRLPVYPAYTQDATRWLSSEMQPAVRRLQDDTGFARDDQWTAGASDRAPVIHQSAATHNVSKTIQRSLDKACAGERLSEEDIVGLFAARDGDVIAICEEANRLRQQVNGDELTYVVNRNINYTNLCYFNCRFCAFSKGHSQHSLRGPAYDLPLDEIVRRAREAWDRGATEVCLQGGIHPQYTGDTYLEICSAIKSAVPGMHIHAFSPLEVWQGAKTLNLPLADFLQRLKDAGLGSLPGTAAEILDDEIRDVICPDKINTETWLQVMRTAHEVGLRTTATIMFGHLELGIHRARHLLRLRDLQADTGGFTEFVPLPFVHMDAPIHQSGLTRPGPTWREALLMHAVARLSLHPLIPNIQASWVKLGPDGVEQCLNAGVNDLGGSLMNESITRAAGAEHGQEFTPAQFESMAASMGRAVRQRTTLYQPVVDERVARSFDAPELQMPVNTLTRRAKSSKTVQLERAGSTR